MVFIHFRESDSCNRLYGKRLKLSDQESAKKDAVATLPRLPMQAKENVEKINVEDDDERCCIVADLFRPKKVGSSLKDGSGNKQAENERFIINNFSMSPKLQKSTFVPGKDNDSDDEIEVINHLTHNSNKSDNSKAENRNFKFFTTQRSFLSHGKTAKSKPKHRNFLKRKKNLLQECYRLTEKFQYLQLLQSQTSCNVFEKKQPIVREPYLLPYDIPLIDLTDEENDCYGKKSGECSLIECSAGDSEVQIVKEVVGIRSLEEMLRIRPVSGEADVKKQGIFSIPSNSNKVVLNFDDLQSDTTNDKETCPETLEAKLHTFMQITDPEIKKVPNNYVECSLPELTPDQENRIQKALIKEPLQEVLAQGFGLSITRRDMQTLKGLNWLNDEVINFYMNLIMERSKENKSLPKVYTFSTFFYPKLVSSGYYSLRKWTKHVDIFSYDLLLVPIHLGLHWCMSIIDFKSKFVKYFDSIGSPNDACLDQLLSFLESESVDKKNQIFQTDGWMKFNVEDIPQQMNGSDCGVFSCMFAEHLAREAEILFTQDDMPYFRKKMVIELLDVKLMT